MRSLHFILLYSMLGDQLFPMIWNAVSRLENLGFIVLALCCDGLSLNRKFFRLYDAGSKTPVNKVINPYAHDGDRRYIFFLSDPPHLMKTTRNCWANPKRKLWVNVFKILFQHACSSCAIHRIVQWNGYLMGPS